MTTSLLAPRETAPRTTSPQPSAAFVLRYLVRDAVAVAADDAADAFSGRTPAGRALLDLAALARHAAGALGTEPGTPLADGPAVVVQREITAAARLLDAAVAVDHDAAVVEPLLDPARRLHAQLHEAVAAGPR